MAVNPCCKYLMFFFNLCIFLGGCAMVGAGIWAIVNTQSFQELVTDDASLVNAIYFILASGSFLLLIGFFGCCGAIKENKCLLGTFFVLVFLIFLVEIVGVVLAFVNLPVVENLIKESMSKYDDGTEGGAAIKESWDFIQTEFNCCGYEGPSDWILRAVPESCPGGLLGSMIVAPGCKSVFQQYFLVVGGIALGVLFIEILAMVFSCCLFRQAGKESSAY